jgi:hypothetical protein
VTPEETAAQRVTTVLAERDAVQANLLELDGSFAKQVLEGAALTGQTRDRWAAASAALATLWETFLAYSAVVDRIAALGTGSKRPARKDLPELNELLTGGCVRLAGAPVPLARRDLAAAGRPPVTLAAAVGAMRRAFSEVTELTAAVEAVWAAVAVPLDAATSELAGARPLVDGLGADIQAEFRDAESALAAQRAAANADPLALWHPAPAGSASAAASAADGSVDTTAADRQWSRLAAELDRCEAELAAATAQTAGVRETAAAALDKRDELRGLLRAYKAKAARLGAAEDPDLAAQYDKAHGLLWTAPCDLTAAEAAVAAYQRAILEGEGRR